MGLSPAGSAPRAGPSEVIEADVLVIGTGIAGAIAALTAADGGLDVVVIDRSLDPEQSNTSWAQGGIIYTGAHDSPELLARDIMAAGGGICHPPAVRRVAETGPRLVQEILVDRLGVEFDRTATGEFDVTEEAAHATPRIIHSRDQTGVAIARGLNKALETHRRIRLFRGTTAIDLLTLNHHSTNPLDIYEPITCVGVYAYVQAERRVRRFLGCRTVLASGGLGQLYLHTTNPRGARGDGVAMAYRAGARLLNLEYVQFHPTALYHETAPRFLISESLRGEGARLVRRDGSSFMEQYDPRGSLAPRDVVARAIHEELLSTEEPCVWLDISHKPADWIRDRFPGIHQRCLQYGIDITREPLPVVPAAHYSCGGVAVDLEGRTTLRNLYAVGEVACTGLHGANRLASTSLLEALVFGHAAGQDVIAQLEKGAAEPKPDIRPWVEETGAVDPALILQDWLTIKYTMWNYVGLVRTEVRLLRAKEILRELQQEIETFYARARLDDELIGLRNGVQAALAVLYAALENRISRGCHYRAD